MKLNKSKSFEEELDLQEIFSIISNSKKLLLIPIIIFIASAILYALSLNTSYNSSIVIEIGHSEFDNGNIEPVESFGSLNDDLSISLKIKNPNNEFTQEVSIKPLEKNLIHLETSSLSMEKNEELLQKYYSYIQKRHQRISDKTIDQSKKNINDSINIVSSNLSYLNTIKNKGNINLAEMAKLQFELDERLYNLREELNTLSSQIFNNSMMIKLTHDQIKPKIKLVIFLGFLTGLTSSLLLIFIKNLFKK